MIKSSIPWTTKQIVRMTEQGTLTFENAVQRAFVWDRYRMSLLIDSILRNYPIPAFYTIRTEEKIETAKGLVSVFDCLDGKQRCNTIAQFKAGVFALAGLDPFLLSNGEEIDCNGMKYEDLPEELRDAFDSYTLTVYCFSDVTDEEVVEIMRRLNNGKPLSMIDITRIKAKDLKGLTELASHRFFTYYLSVKALDGKQNEDIVVKTIALMKNASASLDNKDIKIIYQETDFGEWKERVDEVFDYFEKVVECLANEKAVLKKVLSKTHLVTLTRVMNVAIKEKRAPESVARMLSQFYDGKPSSSEEYNTACTNGCNHSVNVSTRINALMEEYDFFFNSEE